MMVIVINKANNIFRQIFSSDNIRWKFVDNAEIVWFWLANTRFQSHRSCHIYTSRLLIFRSYRMCGTVRSSKRMDWKPSHTNILIKSSYMSIWLACSLINGFNSHRIIIRNQQTGCRWEEMLLKPEWLIHPINKKDKLGFWEKSLSKYGNVISVNNREKN